MFSNYGSHQDSKDNSNSLSMHPSEIESTSTNQSNQNLEFLIQSNSNNEMNSQNGLYSTSTIENLNNEKLNGNIQRDNQKFFEENQKLIAENQKLKSELNIIKANQNNFINNSLESKTNDLLLKLQKIIDERDKLKYQINQLTEDNETLKSTLKQFSLSDINDNSDYLINVSKIKQSEEEKDSNNLLAFDLIEKMINSQANDLSLVSMQKNRLFELINKILKSNKELENQLSESIEYASEFEKNYVVLEQKRVELQDQTDSIMDSLLSSILNMASEYPKNNLLNKRKMKAICENLNQKIQQKLTEVQNQPLVDQVSELVRLIISHFYEEIESILQKHSLSKSKYNRNPNECSKREIALLGHLENTLKYIQSIAGTSKSSLKSDERTFIIAQISRISSFINDELDIESNKKVISLFEHEDIESQILTFFDFVDKEEENKKEEDKKETNSESYDSSHEADDEADFERIKEKEKSCVSIKNIPIRELYNLFKSVVIVNSLIFDHLNGVAEEIVHLRSELASSNENKNNYEQKYIKIAEQVDDLRSEIGHFFLTIKEENQIKNSRNGKSKRSKNSSLNDSLNSSHNSINAYSDNPFLAVTKLIDAYNQIKDENDNNQITIKKLNKKISELNKQDKFNSKMEEYETLTTKLKKENDELKEEIVKMNETIKENSNLKNKVSEALQQVEKLQMKTNKIKEKKKIEEEKTNSLTQQLQISENHVKEIKAQFESLKELATRGANVIKAYKEKEKKYANRILALENQLTENQKNETVKQKEINKVIKIQQLKSKQNEEAKEKYESQLKELSDELQVAKSTIMQMEEEATLSANSKDSLQRDVAKLKLIEKALEMKLKQQEAHALSMVNIERGKCESKILMAKSQIEECLSEHEKRLTKIKFQLLQIIKEFFPESYAAAAATSSLTPLVSTEASSILNTAFSKSNQQSSLSDIGLFSPNNQTPSFLDYKSDNFSSPNSPINYQNETAHSLSFTSPQQKSRSLPSSQQFSSPTTIFSSNQQSSSFPSHPFATLDVLCNSVEASLNSVRACVSRSDFHSNNSTLQEANKVRAQLGMKSSGSLLKKFEEMHEKIEELENSKAIYKERCSKYATEKKALEKSLKKDENVRIELNKWEKWSKALFRQINDEMNLVSNASYNKPAIINESDEMLNSDLVGLNEFSTSTDDSLSSSPFKVIPLLSFDDIRASLEESILASIGHRAMLRKINALRVQKRVIENAYQNLFYLIKPVALSSNSSPKAKSQSAASNSSLALKKFKRNYNYFLCFVLNSNVRFTALNSDPPNSQYAFCSIRHLILIYVFLKRIGNLSGFASVVGSNSVKLSNSSNGSDRKFLAISLTD